MTAEVLTFDQMESKAERTLAVVLWVKHAKHTWSCFFYTVIVSEAVKSLVKELSADEKLNSLNDAQAKELAEKLQAVHARLAVLMSDWRIERLRKHWPLSSAINVLGENTEDLGDIIEDLVLSYNKEFRSALSECVLGITATHPAETVGRM